jgi:glycosyltransferase involved in cell wall biosynthesis
MNSSLQYDVVGTLQADSSRPPVRAFVPSANRFMRSRNNTDWQYAARRLPALNRYCPQLQVLSQENALVDFEVNLRYLASIARGRQFNIFPVEWAYSLCQDAPVYARDVAAPRPYIILSYERYPSRSFGLPVAWMTGPSDEQLLKAGGLSDKQIQKQIAWKRARAEQSAKLIFYTNYSQERFLEQTDPALREKSTVIPFFLPGLDVSIYQPAKWETGDMKFLFVGRQARRKGLPVVLEAMERILREQPAFSLTVISSFDDGGVTFPDLPNLKVLGELDRSEVLRHMEESHMLVMPSSWESYGFVYIEAMSRGCLPLALDRPVQRELIGPNGILVAKQDPEEIRAAVLQVIRSYDYYRERARSAADSFRTTHSPLHVANRFYDELHELCGRAQ